MVLWRNWQTQQAQTLWKKFVRVRISVRLLTHLNLYKSEKYGASYIIGYVQDKISIKTRWVVRVETLFSNVGERILCKGVEIEKPSLKISHMGSNCDRHQIKYNQQPYDSASGEDLVQRKRYARPHELSVSQLVSAKVTNIYCILYCTLQKDLIQNSK